MFLRVLASFASLEYHQFIDLEVNDALSDLLVGPSNSASPRNMANHFVCVTFPFLVGLQLQICKNTAASPASFPIFVCMM